MLSDLQQKASTSAPGQTGGKFQSPAKMSGRFPLCRWRGSYRHSAEGTQQLRNCFSETCRDFGLTISQKKNKSYGTGCGFPIQNYNLRSWTESRSRLCIPMLHHLRHSLLRFGAKPTHWQGSYHHVLADKERMIQQQTIVSRDWRLPISRVERQRKQFSVGLHV